MIGLNAVQYDVMDRIIWTRTGDTLSGDGQQIAQYTYNRFGNVLTMTDTRGRKESFTYDKVGRLQEKTDRNGNRTVYQFDALERLKKETVQSKSADGMITSEREYSYNKTGQASWEASRENVDGKQTSFLETKYFYDPKGRLIRQEDPGNIVKQYSYDTYGNRQSFRLTRNGQAAPDVNLYYVYDDLHRLKQVRRDGAAGVIMAEYEYDIKGNRKSLRYPQTGMEATYTYNKANRVTFLENKKQGVVISAWKYDYDIGGNMVKKNNQTSSAPVTITYCYDRLGRLTEEDYSGWKRTLYEYDARSNRSKMMVEGKTKNELVSVTNYEYGLNNQLEKEVRKQGKVTETWRYRYDDNGNEIFRIWEKTSPTPDYPGSVKPSGNPQREAPTVYEWRHYNGFHQLIRVNQDDKEISYQYRSDGLRHSTEVRELTLSQGKTKVSYWEGSDIVAEQTDGGSVKRYLRGINLIARDTDGMVYYYVLNERGDVAQMWGQSGTCKASYEYDAFGNERNQSTADENPFRYCGEYLDLETKTYYLRARNYRPAIGRFMSEDPIRAGLNWYTYCGNNPITFIDPLGLDAILINKPTERGITNKVGQEHMSILMQDKDGNWFYNAFMGDYVAYAAVSNDIDVTDLSSLSKWLKENDVVDKEWYDFTRSAYVEGDFTQPLSMVARYEDIPDKKYQKYANKIEYSPNAIQSSLDDLARKAVKEDFAANYSPLFNNCGHVAMKWFAMGKMPNSDKTYGKSMGSIGNKTMRTMRIIISGYGPEFYRSLSPDKMFNSIYDYYAIKSRSRY